MYIRSQDKAKVAKLDSIVYEKQAAFHLIKVNGVKFGEYNSEDVALEEIGTVTALLYQNKSMYELK